MKRLLCTILAAVAMSATTVNAVAQKPDLLEIIEMTGEIHEGSARAIAEQVEAINETPKVKAVLLVVDSPGGGVMPSAVIYEAESGRSDRWRRA